MTLGEFVSRNRVAARIYESGIPTYLESPFGQGWEHGDPSADELSLCQLRVFMPVGLDPKNADLNLIAWAWDCIGFLTAEEAFEWIPIWMCASLYALIVLGRNDPIDQYTSFTLMDLLRTGKIPTSIHAVELFFATTDPGGWVDGQYEECLHQYDMHGLSRDV